MFGLKKQDIGEISRVGGPDHLDPPFSDTTLAALF